MQMPPAVKYCMPKVPSVTDRAFAFRLTGTQRISKGRTSQSCLFLLEKYDIKSAKNIENALKDLLGGTIQEIHESEMNAHLRYQEYERSDNPDSCSGIKTRRCGQTSAKLKLKFHRIVTAHLSPRV